MFGLAESLKYWMPKPYPKTEKERLEAAEKYGLHPDVYKPEPNDEFSIGDYPQMPWEGVEARDPFYPWDLPGMRKNYNEPVRLSYY